ncbi:MAG: hypothetical protein WCF36_09865 [Candidatus Nanopelagicales bacterium]
MYDLRTNLHFTLKTKPLREGPTSTPSSPRTSPGDRSQRVESQRFHQFTELAATLPIDGLDR